MVKPDCHAWRDQCAIPIKPLGFLWINGETSIAFGQVMSLAINSLQCINSSWREGEKIQGRSEGLDFCPE